MEDTDEKFSEEENKKESKESKPLIKKARNYFILGKIGESLKMFSESASNYFKSLSAVNDFVLSKINLEPKDHGQRFSMLKEHFPEFYKITDSLFTVYRKTYTSELTKEELSRLREKIKEAFQNAKIRIPTLEEIKEQAEILSKK